MERPAGKAQGTQRWHRLVFSHWEVPEAVLRPHVHPRLTLDAFEGRCFVGVVAFQMLEVKPFGFGVPTATNFEEINLRTYVHLEGKEPGVVFLSLDATSTLATLAARTVWRVPYHRSRIVHEDAGERVRWTCDRRWPGPKMEGFTAELEVGAALPQPQPGSLEHFLVERYQFYADEPLRRARVHHAPYALNAVPRCEMTAALLTAAGLPGDGKRTPDYFSEGVDVEVFPLERVP